MNSMRNREQKEVSEVFCTLIMIFMSFFNKASHVSVKLNWIDCHCVINVNKWDCGWNKRYLFLGERFSLALLRRQQSVCWYPGENRLFTGCVVQRATAHRGRRPWWMNGSNTAHPGDLDYFQRSVAVWLVEVLIALLAPDTLLLLASAFVLL